MTQQDIALGLVRTIIIMIFGLGALFNFYYMLTGAGKHSPPVNLVGLFIDLTVVYFTWTL